MPRLLKLSALALAVAVGAFDPAASAPPGSQAPAPVAPATPSQPGPGQAPAPGMPIPLRPPEPKKPTLTDRLNDNTISIISGNPNGGYLGIAHDISVVLDDGEEMRVLPIVGRGAVQNMIDVLHLRGVDMGLTNPGVLDHFKKTGEFGKNIEERLAYITTLFQDELHILAGPSIESFQDLDKKRVNFSDIGSGAQLTARLLFAAHGIEPQEFNMGQADAIEKIKAGELDATLCTCLKPLRPLQELDKELGLKLLAIQYDSKVHGRYLPTQFTHDDYPNLIPPDSQVETIAVPTILAVYNWPKNTDRYRRVAKFVDRLFTNFAKLHDPPRHPRWKTVNFAATVPGWKRFPAAQEWIDRARAQQQQRAAERARFERFLTENPADQAAAESTDENSQRELYKKFQQWERRQKQ